MCIRDRQYYLQNCEMVKEAKVHERTQDAVISFCGDRAELIHMLQTFSYEKAEVDDSALTLSGRKTNREYADKLAMKTIMRFGSKLFFPYPLRYVTVSYTHLLFYYRIGKRGYLINGI